MVPSIRSKRPRGDLPGNDPCGFGSEQAEAAHSRAYIYRGVSLFQTYALEDHYST